MGITIYWIIITLVVVLGMALPQQGKKRKYYIVLMAVLHTFVCGFRYKFLTGDLIKYNTTFQDVRYFSYFSDRVINDWKNTGFYWLQKLIADLSGGNFQLFLFIIALIVEIIVAILIFRYSSKPWLSYLAWNCIGFYIFGFSAVKQSLAMALVMVAMIGILENNVKIFLVFSLLAGFIHFPAFGFLPAYWLAKNKINLFTTLIYIGTAIIVYLFRNPIVDFMTDLYYEEDQIVLSSDIGLGERFFLIVLILLTGAAMKGFSNRNFEKTYNILIIAAFFQMFSGFNNVFTRFADYYFQFSILFLPLMVSNTKMDTHLSNSNRKVLLPFNERSLKIISMMLAVCLIWYYYQTCLSQTISNDVDNYLNFRFMWDVVP